MTPRVTPRRPSDTLLLADLALVGAVAPLGVAAALYLVGRGLNGVAAAALVPGGWLLGLIGARLFGHPFRVLGLTPLAATLGLGLALAGQLALGRPDWLAALVALTQGVALGGVLRYRGYQRGKPLRLALAAVVGLALAAAAVALLGPRDPLAPEAGRDAAGWTLVGGTALLALVGWVGFARHAAEVVLDPVFRSMYHCRRFGPGVERVPRAGPVLVIANHAAWFDPVLVAEAVHRETAPMMTAGFYDLPFMSWLMRKVFRVIRVSDSPARRDVPEIEQAIEALDAGQCVVIFPEGYLRRKDDEPLRRFGRGVWQILKSRPATPVVPCWIEGTWGSYFSHKGGPPTKNKQFDFRRRVRVGVSEPVAVPAGVLADHLATRAWLMNRVGAARAHVGLDALPAVELARGEVQESGLPGEPGA